jgi:zinc protease
MRRLPAVCVAVAIALTTFGGVRGFAQAQAADLPTVDQVLDKFIAAAGGRAAFEKLTSRESKGTVESPDAPLRGTIEVFEKAPDKALSVIDLQGIGIVREGADGTVAWQDDPQSGVQEKTGADLAEAKRSSTFNAEIKMKQIYKTVAVTGKETIGGKAAYVITATPAEGLPTRYSFDIDTGLLVKQHSTRDTPQGPMDVDVFLEDFRDVDGIKSPFTIRQVTPLFTMIVRLTEIKHNVTLDDAIFKKPGLR